MTHSAQNEYVGQDPNHSLRLRVLSRADLKSKIKALKIVYGIHNSPFGEVFLALNGEAICHLIFLSEDDRQADIDQAFVEISNRFSVKKFLQDQQQTENVVKKIFNSSKKELTLLTHGTDFQITVWKALLQIPSGEVTSYSKLAELIGKPKAARAIGNAVGANPISLLIPCHRVVRRSGVIGHYRWGRERKVAMLKMEGAI